MMTDAEKARAFDFLSGVVETANEMKIDADLIAWYKRAVEKYEGSGETNGKTL